MRGGLIPSSNSSNFNLPKQDSNEPKMGVQEFGEDMVQQSLAEAGIEQSLINYNAHTQTSKIVKNGSIFKNVDPKCSSVNNPPPVKKIKVAKKSLEDLRKDLILEERDEVKDYNELRFKCMKQKHESEIEFLNLQQKCLLEKHQKELEVIKLQKKYYEKMIDRFINIQYCFERVRVGG